MKFAISSLTAALTALATLTAAATPAISAGFQQIVVPDPDGPPLEGGIWYPSGAPVSSQPVGLFEQAVAPEGAVAGHGLPLIVMSHGSGGSFEGHYDTALALADAGFVVAAITHTGDNYRDHGGFARVEARPRHIKSLIDYMLSSWPQHALLDPARIGMFGFSVGGFTALVLLGAKPDMTRIAPYCVAHPEEWACRKGKDYQVDPTAASTVAFVHDPRVVAAVVAAPAIGYTFSPQGLSEVKAPIQLWRGDSDEILPHPRHAQNVYDALAVKPEYHVVPEAGHFAFLAPCNPALARVAPEICHDREGFDRVAFHREFNHDVVEFFQAKLAAPAGEH